MKDGIYVAPDGPYQGLVAILGNGELRVVADPAQHLAARATVSHDVRRARVLLETWKCVPAKVVPALAASLDWPLVGVTEQDGAIYVDGVKGAFNPEISAADRRRTALYELSIAAYLDRRDAAARDERVQALAAILEDFALFDDGGMRDDLRLAELLDGRGVRVEGGAR